MTGEEISTEGKKGTTTATSVVAERKEQGGGAVGGCGRIGHRHRRRFRGGKPKNWLHKQRGRGGGSRSGK